ncbi:hypothetical protein ASPCADRAFT_129047 [Aspergillus carbonarius ITEM 5010]|uniref:Extracellular membrane protein CFEM domain-containing protein n=1 Tax=Aspergillus carbonarius (strain ITEM 5010) TaxID=602072 RepID=A0A1R3RSC1_ASPC5|nr:hypothetical protein ASPCADRAFT_129047 [Aspergillus carbonarius ITEM 5010]
MKFNSALALSSLLALAVAQDASSTSSSATTTASLSPQASCATKCADTDICCIAQCYEVPCPNNAQANDTTSCVAACPQGSGSPSDQKSYASCQSSCYSSYFFPASATGASGSSATTAGSNDASTTNSGSSSSSTGSRLQLQIWLLWNGNQHRDRLPRQLDRKRRRHHAAQAGRFRGRSRGIHPGSLGSVNEPSHAKPSLTNANPLLHHCVNMMETIY